MFKRIVVIVLDSMGIGNAKDAHKYGDVGANTLLSASNVLNFSAPNLEKLGLGMLGDFPNISKNHQMGYAFKANELSNGKDTTVGHFEFVGVHTDVPFPVFTETGFPQELIDELEKRTGHKFIGNYASSGTVILDELGDEHVNSKALILYTSNDSVIQIAAHEEVIPLEELYRVCEITREVTLKDEWKLARVIARPFVGESGNWKRTANRHDYSLTPPHKTVLNYLESANLDVISVGKIADIYNDYGITRKIKSKSNMDGVDKTIECLQEDFQGLLFTNLVEFDSEYGHRRNCEGYGQAIMDFDKRLPEIINALQEDDLLILTADHGNDPGFAGTDHTREQIPVLAYSKQFANSDVLDERMTFADIGATIAENFNVTMPEIGKSFLEELK